MNSFTLGKLAEIHIQGLVDGADESRRARRVTSPTRDVHIISTGTRSVKRTPRSNDEMSRDSLAKLGCSSPGTSCRCSAPAWFCRS